MRIKFFVLLMFVMVVPYLLLGCVSKAASSSEAVKQAETMQTVEQKTNYLISQANAFLNSKDYEDAVNTAKYVLANLDKESKQAMDILEKAKAKLAEAATGMMADMKKSVSGIAK